MRKVEEMGGCQRLQALGRSTLNYAEQVQKRKMLWKKPGTELRRSRPLPSQLQRRKEEQSIFASEYAPEKKPAAAKPAPGPVRSINGKATNFGDDEANEKVRRLMGIKAAPKPDEFASEDALARTQRRSPATWKATRWRASKPPKTAALDSDLPVWSHTNPRQNHRLTYPSSSFLDTWPSRTQQGYGHPGGQVWFS